MTILNFVARFFMWQGAKPFKQREETMDTGKTSPTNNAKLAAWVEETIALCKPESVVWWTDRRRNTTGFAR